MILSVFQKQYETLKQKGFQPCKDKDGPILSVGFVPCPREPLEVLERNGIKVFFYDLPEICVTWDGNQEKINLLIKEEFDNFIEWVRLRTQIENCTKTTSIHMTYRHDLVWTKNVLFSIEDSNGYPLLNEYTLDEMLQLDDERLFEVMYAFDCIRELFEEVIKKRNERARIISEEIGTLTNAPAEMTDLPRCRPSRKPYKHKE